MVIGFRRALIHHAIRISPAKSALAPMTPSTRHSMELVARLRRWCRDLYRFPSRVWLWRHESGTYVKFTPAGAELFA